FLEHGGDQRRQVRRQREKRQQAPARRAAERREQKLYDQLDDRRGVGNAGRGRLRFPGSSCEPPAEAAAAELALGEAGTPQPVELAQHILLAAADPARELGAARAWRPLELGEQQPAEARLGRVRERPPAAAAGRGTASLRAGAAVRGPPPPGRPPAPPAARRAPAATPPPAHPASLAGGRT